MADETNNTVKEIRTRDVVREELAAYAHEAWSGWMRYMFGKCFSNDAGELTIPAWAVARWTRQMSTPYNELPIGENESDRAEADKMIAIFAKHTYMAMTGQAGKE